MSGLFGSRFGYDGNWQEGTVHDVSPTRFTCTVYTISGQTLTDVTWLMPGGGTGQTGTYTSPTVGDRVLVNTSLSYPVILGCLPRLGPSGENGALSTDSGLDPGDVSNIRNGLTMAGGKPQDFKPGDFMVSGEGEVLFGVIKTGSILVRASALAQIFISKFNDTVRIIARNFTRASDASAEMAVNIKGRIYSWFGSDWDVARTRTTTGRYQEVIGDVVAGETFGPIPDVTALPVRDSRVKKVWLKDGASGNSVMVETLYEDGRVLVTVSDPVTVANKTTEDQTKSMWNAKAEGGTVSQVTIVPGSVTVSYNGTSVGLFDATGISLDANGHYVHIDSSGVHMG